ncbi:CsbD family protein [Corynebacterium sp. KPL2830]|jgi:hypothetical protein|uniref:CsbD family protein n=1 Tax=unclassified Corynebacterium TaxID=2624378 RepID=UPI0032ECF995
MGDLENKKDDLAGKAKEAVGEATGNEDVANEGKADQVVSDAKDKLSDAADNIKDKANDIIGGLKKD